MQIWTCSPSFPPPQLRFTHSLSGRIWFLLHLYLQSIAFCLIGSHSGTPPVSSRFPSLLRVDPPFRFAGFPPVHSLKLSLWRLFLTVWNFSRRWSEGCSFVSYVPIRWVSLGLRSVYHTFVVGECATPRVSGYVRWRAYIRGSRTLVKSGTSATRKMGVREHGKRSISDGQRYQYPRGSVCLCRNFACALMSFTRDEGRRPKHSRSSTAIHPPLIPPTIL